ncbi:Imm8 family immunity protein [Curtobacterium sp. MCPF17_018]|uniref:Imm8 family immunity protein n=1 Tax=Curtobacterium sp. MCPF17_018 TaxID=2175638 RepID=UPI00281691FE|nr:Imm8 family immunity protein [Curtobacterium sp. MCPF17_018]
MAHSWGLLQERHMVVVATWDSHQIRSFINRLFTEVEGRDWQEVSNKLSRLGVWEFEDYKA